MNNYILKYIFPPFIFLLVIAEYSYSAFTVLENTQPKQQHYPTYQEVKELYQKEKFADALKKSFIILDKSTDTLEIIKSYNLIGDIFRQTGYPKKSSIYHKKALKVLQTNNPKATALKAITYFRVANSFHLREKKTDSAIYFYNKIIKIENNSNEILKLKADSYSALSGVYAYLNEKKNFNKATNFALKAIEIHKKNNDAYGLVADYANLGSIYLDQGKLQKAKKFYQKSLKLIEKDKSSRAIQLKQTVYDNLGWCLYQLKDYRAYDYLDLSFEIKDSLNNIKFEKEMAKLDLKYNIDIVKKEEINKRQQLKINSWIIGAFSILAIGVLFVFMNIYKLRQKNLKLELSKKELEQSKRLDKIKSEAQENILNATIDGREEERKLIAEILHDNVSALLSSANMHIQASKNHFSEHKLPNELVKTQQIITEASQKIRNLSHNLISSVLLKFGLGFAIKDTAVKFSNSEIKIHPLVDNINRYPQDIEIKIYNIILELINNILKHSKAKNAYIVAKETNNILNIVVKDDGEGFEYDEINSGIGINQIKARTKLLRGDFTIETNKNGTKITLNIPVTNRLEA